MASPLSLLGFRLEGDRQFMSLPQDIIWSNPPPWIRSGPATFTGKVDSGDAAERRDKPA